MFERLKKAANPNSEMSFLDHLEALRWHLVRSAIVVVIFAILAFSYREIVFDKIIFAARHPDFWTYVQFCKLSDFLGLGDALCIDTINFDLINTQLSGQFTMHMWIAVVTGLILGFPYVVWEIWRFVKPGLKENEKKYTTGIVFFTTILFAMGVLFGYFIIAPLSINFLGNYQISTDVKNMIEMDSFISTVTTITLAAGFVFELPIVVYFLTQIGLISPAFMRKFRKHAVVVILIAAAVITPSPDITSQLLVAFPLYFLYEISIFVSLYVLKKAESKSK
jgi:sec-independent protein translocase protein TatC